MRQFSVFTDNRVGRLHALVQKLGSRDIHIMALSQLDTTESSIIRFIVDYHEAARALLEECHYPHVETELLAVEVKTEAGLKYVTAALVEAEINIHYLYPFLSRPNGKSAFVLHLEDNDLAAEVLRAHQIRVLDQSDIAR